MSEQRSVMRMNRRRFLNLAGQFSLAAVGVGLLQACGGAAATSTPGAATATTTKGTIATASTGAASTAAVSSTTSSAMPGTPNASGQASRTTLPFVWLGDLNPLWHPSQYTTFGQAVVFSLIFNNLTKLDEDLKTIIPDLAEKWEVSPDASQYTFHLHQNVKWQDGTPFTAKDVIFSFSRQIVEPYSYTKFMTAVKGAQDYKDGKAQTVAGLEQLDDYTVKITLNAPDSLFLLNLTEPGNVIVPEHLLKDVKPEAIDKAPFTLNTPVGTGPYKFVRYLRDQYVEFAVNPDYFKGKPKITALFMKQLQSDVTVAQLESGEVGLALRLSPIEYDRLTKVPTLNVISQAGVGQVGEFFPCEQKRMSDKRVRQAIYYAIDRKGIVDGIYQGRAQALNGAPPALDGYKDLNAYAYNQDKAKQLLKEAGFDLSAPVRIIYDQTYPLAPQYYPVIAQQLQQVGLKVELNALDSTAYANRFNKQRDSWELAGFYGGAWGLGPHITGQYFNCHKPGWESGYLNCDMDQLFTKAAQTGDPGQRDEVYHQIAKILNEDVPMASLWMPNDLHAATKKLGGGFSAYRDPRRTFTKVETWTLS